MRLRVVGVVVAVAGVAIVGVGLWQLVDSYDSPSGPSAVVRAVRPFRNLTETRIGVGTQRLRVVIADDDSERIQGLRRRRDIGSYDGMLFVYQADTTTGFTMSTVPVALDIGFYGADGSLVTRLRMVPCAGAESECPVYRADDAFRYALETLAGRLPHGRLKVGSLAG